MLTNFSNLQDKADSPRACPDASYKAAVEAIDKFVAGAAAAEKGEPRLPVAAQLPTTCHQSLALVLYAAMEAHGGTSIARSNVWYTSGFSRAAVVTSGPKASFTLRNPATGSILITGIVRCMTSPTSYRDADKLLVTRRFAGEGSVAKRQRRLTGRAQRTSRPETTK